MYEHRNDPLLPRRKYVKRVARHGMFSFALITVSLGIGIAARLNGINYGLRLE